MLKHLFKLLFVFTLSYLLVDSLAINYFVESTLLESHNQTRSSFSDQENSPAEEEAETEEGKILTFRNPNKIVQYRTSVVCQAFIPPSIDLFHFLGKSKRHWGFEHLYGYYTHLSLYHLF